MYYLVVFENVLGIVWIGGVIVFGYVVVYGVVFLVEVIRLCNFIDFFLLFLRIWW